MTILIPVCILLLIAYVFDLTASRSRIPSVILLLLLGWAVRQLTDYLDFQLDNLAPWLPVLGTVGLILIVLEGSLELELEKSKKKLIGQSLIMALMPILLISIGMASWLLWYYDVPFKQAITNALPFCVISSAVAIPSAKGLEQHQKEFVIYESSFSDIIGVLLFNFVALNETINSGSIVNFGLELIAMSAISLGATVGLAFMLRKIQHPIKYGPIILIVILIYALSKQYHLPGLLFMMVFGLFLGNLDELRKIPIVRSLHPEKLDEEVHKFHELTTEAAFLIRALFFLVFGFLMETERILNPGTLPSSLLLVAGIYISRFLLLKLLRRPVRPLLFIAPRGLITILLFYSVIPAERISFINQSMVVQVILITAFIMMGGLLFNQKSAGTSKLEGDN